MQSRWSRVVHGLGAGTVATLVAAASHSVAGGRIPGVAGVALALCFAVIVSIALAGRRLSAVRVTASVVLSQLAFHVVFSTIGGAGEVSSDGHHGHLVMSAAQSVSHASSDMWIAHVLAAVLTIIALRFGERAIVAIRETGRMLASAITTVPAVPHLPFDRVPVPAPITHLVPRIVREFHAALGLRGPPLALCSA